ncbi:MAG: hypothetical protein ACLFO1_00045 [Spirochaetaceae bacterium]
MRRPMPRERRHRPILLLPVLLAALFLSTPLWSQENTAEEDRVPTGFDTITLGAAKSEVQELLQGNSYFRYRGDPDVSLLPFSQERSVIEAEGRTFIDRAFFQFNEQALYIIILQLNPDRMDHYSVYQSLTSQYGEATRVGPREIVWEWENVRLSLERPLTVKYIDLPVFEALRGEAQVERSLREVTRDRFLEDL